MGVEKALYGLKYAIRWHPGTSLASGHVVGIRARRWHNTNFAQTAKNDFFQKKHAKNFAVCENLPYLCTV